MSGVAAFLPLDGFVADGGPRLRVLLCQLPLSLAMALCIGAAATFSSGVLANQAFLLSLVAHGVLLLSCVVVPWERLPRNSVAAVPILDCLAIGFSREAVGQAINIVGMLVVFPVVWLALHRRKTGLLLAIVATAVSASLPPLVLRSGIEGPSMIRIVMLPVIMLAVGITAHAFARSVAAQRGIVLAQEDDVRRLLAQTEHRQRLLDSVVETVNVGVCVIAKDGTTVLMNRRMRRDLARAAEGVPAGEPTLFTSDGRTPVTAETNPVRRAADGASFTDELYWTGRGKEQRAYSVTARPMRDADGAFGGSVIAYTDVTSLVSALAARESFVATVSHELRTPLTSILGYLELAQDQDDILDVRKDLAVIERNAHRLHGLVNDLLAVASNNHDLTFKRADLRDVIESAADSAKPQAAMAGIQIVIDAPEPVPAKIDVGRMGQVMDNLLSNAIKYSPDGGTVTISAEVRAPHITCTVTDTGIGMDKDLQERAFTSFFRAEQAKNSAIPGAGLGLPITKTIIERHGGSISLSSKPGAGTSVTFVLPASVDEVLVPVAL